MIGEIALIAVLLLLLYFFSTAETALTVVSKPLMHQLELEGDDRAGLVNRLHQRKERMIGAILLGNTLVQILASAIATTVALKVAGDVGVAYETAIMTVIILVFCEILPKTVALHHANRLAPVIAPVMRAMVLLFGPFVQGVQMLVNGLLRLLGLHPSANPDPDAALAELRGAIDIHAAEDETGHERKMLRSILDLAEVEVGEIMIHRKNMVMLNADLPVEAVIEQATSAAYTRLPLWRGQPDNIVGVLHSKELLRALRSHGGDLEAIDPSALASPPWFIPESTSLLEQLQAFRKRREHFALVVDEYGSLLGVVTLEDIIEEIVGDISDEHYVLAAAVRPQGDGSYIVAGEATLRDLNREFDWRLPDEDAATLAGLLLHESRIIPDVGQVFLFHGFRFEVLRRQRNQIASVRVTPPQPDQAEDGA